MKIWSLSLGSVRGRLALSFVRGTICGVTGVVGFIGANLELGYVRACLVSPIHVIDFNSGG